MCITALHGGSLVVLGSNSKANHDPIPIPLGNRSHNNFANSCNPETIRRVLRKAGYHGPNMRRKSFASKVNRQKRIDFAKEMKSRAEIFGIP
ncbi:hypothetical protein TNCV_1139391 [Trichonephila clavipes]|nr:hypothetical protein TNCV_1139391 [Trichonephila clavipes]